MPTIPLRRLLSGIRAHYHVWSGRRAYRAGRIRTAGRHLDEAISRGHQSFSSFLLMGKVAFRERDMGRAADCFHRARCADPVRFSLEGFPDDFIASLRSRPDSVPRQAYRVIIESGRSTGAREPARSGAPRARRQPRLGDFSSQAEWAEAQGRPAIRPGEAEDVDWDAEARRFFDDEA